MCRISLNQILRNESQENHISFPAVNPGIGVKGLSKHKNNTIFRLSIIFALK